MTTPQNPNDPDSLSLKPSRGGASGTDGKADFSNVSSSASSTERQASPTADFSKVQSAVSSSEEATGTGSYTVQKGDTLSHIAQAQYGRASQWKRIFEANRDQLDDPDRIQPGQVLKIPAAPAEE